MPNSPTFRKTVESLDFLLGETTSCVCTTLRNEALHLCLIFGIYMLLSHRKARGCPSTRAGSYCSRPARSLRPPPGCSIIFLNVSYALIVMAVEGA